MARIALHITGDDKADAVISRDPLALLIGMVLDQQVTIEKAFSSPADLLQRLGTKGPLNAATIAAMDPEELAGIFREQPALHRYPGSMASRVQAVCRVVADEYASVCEQIDRLYATAAVPGALPAEIETAAMAKLRTESHARMLGNGMCTRPAELECRMESACETCAYFRTGIEFVPVLMRQRDHAREHNQPERAALFDGLIVSTKESGA